MYSHSNNLFLNELEPSEFYLSPNYPNPFREKTTIKYCVPYRTRVLLTVYNEKNEEIIKLVDEVKNPGTYEIEFSVEKHRDASLQSGTFFYRLEAGEYRSEKKMILIQ